MRWESGCGPCMWACERYSWGIYTTSSVATADWWHSTACARSTGCSMRGRWHRRQALGGFVVAQMDPRDYMMGDDRWCKLQHISSIGP